MEHLFALTERVVAWASIAVAVAVDPLHLLCKDSCVALLLQDLNLFHKVMIDFFLLFVLIHHGCDLDLKLIVDWQVLSSDCKCIQLLLFGKKVVLKLEERLKAYPL